MRLESNRALRDALARRYRKPRESEVSRVWDYLFIAALVLGILLVWGHP